MVKPAATRAFAALLHDRTGQELGAGRSWVIETALLPLLRTRGLDSLDRLAEAVAHDEGLAGAVVDALLNNETSFFRDRAAFSAGLTAALASIADARVNRRLTIWSAGCSTGQEIYSIAMLLAAEAERWAGWTIDLIGTDISDAAIARARAGIYTQFEIQRGLPTRDMLRWFEPIDEEWRVGPALRGRVRLMTHNMLEHPPAGLKADVILCRNVLLYLAPAKRGLVFERLASALADDGVLMLGAGETVLGQSRAFMPDPVCRGLYRRREWVMAGAGPLRAAG